MSETPNTGSEKALVPKKYQIPIHLNDISSFDGAFTFMKERFNEEMRRVEEEMALLSKNLMNLYSETSTYQVGLHSNTQKPSCFWDTVTNSPLVEGEGDEKTMRLQFDVSQFEPGEVTVKIDNNTLMVTAQHEEKSDATIIHNQYRREFLLPSGLQPESIESCLSKDGVLTVKVPLNHPVVVGQQYYI